MWNLSFLFLITAISLVSLSCANLFEPLTPKDTDQALLYEARKEIDSGNFITAINYLSEMSPEFGAQNDVRVTFASAYAGACGMQFIPFFTSISQANLSPPNTLFKYLRNSFTAKAAAPNYCILSEAKLKEIGTTEALRLAAMFNKKEVNMLMAILAMAKVGAILRTKSDLDGTDSLGDGTTDATFNSCTNDAANLTDDEVLEVATGFGLLIENLPSLLGASNATSTALAGVSLLISALCGAPAPASGCVIIEKESLSAPEKTTVIDAYRDLLKSQDAGLESCTPLTNSCC